MTATLYRIDHTGNMARFYRLNVTPDLFGQWCLCRSWGRIGTEGQGKQEAFNTEAAANDAAARILRRKLKRGYERGVA